MRCYAALLYFAALVPVDCARGQGASPTPRTRIEALGADLADLERRYDVPMSAERRMRLRQRLEQEQAALRETPFEPLDSDQRVDLLLLENYVARELFRLDEEQRHDEALQPWLGATAPILSLAEARLRLEDVDPQQAAARLAEVAVAVDAVRSKLAQDDAAAPDARLSLRGSRRLRELRRTLREWFEFRDGYDPSFGWWTKAPYTAADAALDQLATALRERADKGPGDQSLRGDPIGEAALQRELGFEWIPYTPAELVAIAEREFAFCDAEMAAAATSMQCADWRQALAKVKERHRPPGEQPALIRDLAHEAIAFLEQRDLITIPPLAKECWRMTMLSREAQRVNPFFLGGETIHVAFPTDAMAHIEKLQALRSNNEHFCRATVHHELIPGHWLQQYSQARHRTWRGPFGTPFWMEGWALYWEMRMYELGLWKGPEDKVGMLYWRKHRCARIVFSLNFHLGRWTGPQCVDYLIDRVGHERAAAEGEVRRSLSGGYGPLYQAAYMLGGLQLRALHGELVGQGGWSEKRFHDAVLAQNSVPIAAVRLALGGAEVPRQPPAWRFADPTPR
jgi:uncharacterized protein (DUF885 family)